jgi:hypothetical protein
MLVQRGLNPPQPKPAPPEPQADELDKLFEKGGKLMQFMTMVKSMKNQD